MGYHTEFDGQIKVEPPLSAKEVEYINAFCDTRRMDRENGPYFVGSDNFHDPDVRDGNRPPAGQPSLWCNWCATEDGEFIEWSGAEKFYDSPEWMQYIINHFLGQSPIAKDTNKHFDFLQGHTLNGVIDAEGEEQGDVWKLIVTDNQVTVKEATLSWD